MLCNLQDLLQPAREQGYAVACFNVFGYEDARAVVDAAEQLDADVILSINLDMTQFMPLAHIAAMLRPLAEDTAVKTCLHLDHCYDIVTVFEAIDGGFSSVMYDCSQLPIIENIEGIRRVADYAHAHGVSVEAEVGSVPYASGRDHIKSAMTDVDEALALEREASPDAIAISIGNVHRIESGYVEIDFEHFDVLRNALKTPLVIHGTSGIRDCDVQRLAAEGVCKFNIGTSLRQRFGETLRESLADDPDLFDRLTIMRRVVCSMAAEAETKIRLLGR